MMAFLMRNGNGKTVALYTACADENYCKAELLLLLEKAPADAKVLGFYDVDPNFPVKDFLKSYKGREEEMNRMLVKVKLGGFRFEEVGIPRLVMGVDQPSPTPEQEAERIADLKAAVEYYIPEFAKGVQEIANRKQPDVIILHQDAFAAGYHKDEYTLFGMALKYAGLYGVHVNVHGKSHETFE
ncbi:MAG TPA: hypothetical protein VH682_09930 [Gemmataceae bacterium]|jgi:hypothetical protein